MRTPRRQGAARWNRSQSLHLNAEDAEVFAEARGESALRSSAKTLATSAFKQPPPSLARSESCPRGAMLRDSRAKAGSVGRIRPPGELLQIPNALSLGAFAAWRETNLPDGSPMGAAPSPPGKPWRRLASRSARLLPEYGLRDVSCRQWRYSSKGAFPKRGESFPNPRQQIPTLGESIPRPGDSVATPGEMVPMSPHSLAVSRNHANRLGKSAPSSGECRPRLGEQIPRHGGAIPSLGERFPRYGDGFPRPWDFMARPGDFLARCGNTVPTCRNSLAMPGERVREAGDSVNETRNRVARPARGASQCPVARRAKVIWANWPVPEVGVRVAGPAL